ncbi:MAG: BadF/BadG/BcrA/BcrD ATPase family protein [Microlunatus sp.]
MSELLAIDGGGTKTILAAANRDGEIVLWLDAVGINPMDNPAWHSDLMRLFAAAGREAASAQYGVLALPAFGEVDSITNEQRAAANSLLACRHEVINDVDAAHVGAFAGGSGVLVLAGTGSMVWARDDRGRSLRVGGWGDAFGDEGSAYWIGREAIARVSHVLDGRLHAKAFADGVFNFLGLDGDAPQNALLQWVVGLDHQRSKIAAVSAVVDQLAMQGDQTATSILDEAAQQLALHVEAARQRLGPGSSYPWSYAGGVFASRHVRKRLAELLGCEPVIPQLAPIGGALLRAARHLEWPVDKAWIDRLKASIAKCAVHSKNGCIH